MTSIDDWVKKVKAGYWTVDGKNLGYVTGKQVEVPATLQEDDTGRFRGS